MNRKQYYSEKETLPYTSCKSTKEEIKRHGNFILKHYVRFFQGGKNNTVYLVKPF